MSVALAYVDEIAARTGFDATDRDTIGRAVREAISNVISHAFEPNENASFEIACDRVPLGLRVTVRDRGMPFDPATVPECEPSLDPESEPSPGCGILSMQEAVDEVHFRNLGPEGKETVLVKYLKTRDITDYIAACELDPYPHHEAPRSTKAQHRDIIVREMKPSEAIEIAKSVYRAYAYTYANEDAYYPERIVELNRSGEMLSAVAMVDDRDIAGHGALLFHERGPIGETGMGVVKPEFRSLGILTRIEQFLIDKAREKGLVGVFGRPVTAHTFTQKVGARFQLKTCGVLVGYLPQTPRFRGIAEKLSQRETLLIDFFYLDRPPSGKLYPPPHHREILEGLYGNLGVYPDMRSFSPDSIDTLNGESDIHTVVSSSLNGARINIRSYGANVINHVASLLRELCTRPIDVIRLYLNLYDPWTGRLTEQFEEMGFFFAGILPSALPEDALILQYLNNVPIDYSKIQVVSQGARELLAYVRNRDPNQT